MTLEGWRKFIGAVAILSGTIIGVGIFGLPYVAWRAGFIVVVAYLAWGTFIALVCALVFGELMFRTPGNHRVPGYVRYYLGQRWGALVFISAVTGIFGGQLVYLLVGGHFLRQLAAPFGAVDERTAVAIYAALGALLIAGPDVVLARAEVLLLGPFLGALALIVMKAVPFVDFNNLDTVRASGIILPYGVVMFSMWGLSAVAESREYLGRQYRKLLLPAMCTAFPLCAAAYLMFTGAVMSGTGSGTTPDALGGLQSVLGNGVVWWFYCFGLLTTFTSYISFGRTLRKIFSYDAHWRAPASWLVAVAVPFLLYLSGVKNFLLLMGLVGAFSLGFDAISLLVAYQRAQQRSPAERLPYRLTIPRGLSYALIGLLAVGMVSTMISLLTGAGGS